jgi:hypothetical protein
MKKTHKQVMKSFYSSYKFDKMTKKERFENNKELLEKGYTGLFLKQKLEE